MPILSASTFLFLIFILSTGHAQKPVDGRATRQTRHLLKNLHSIANAHFLFGHQDDLAYGVGWRNTAGRSDVLETSGSYPAVFGWDIGHKLDDVQNIDSVDFNAMKGWMKQVYTMGGINTISWHTTNFSTAGNSWDTSSTVKEILPGGGKHAEFLRQLDLLADFLNDLKVGNKSIPIIFRPWHEHNGNWFWWGKGNCTEEEYIRLYKFTADYLIHTKQIHQLLFAFSPDRSRIILNDSATANYLYGYPGDNYVDIIGLDNYSDVGRSGTITQNNRDNFINGLKLISRIAKAKGKVAALTETGLEGVKSKNWFTDVILNPIVANSDEISLAYVMVWRNANSKHHYAPYQGHDSVNDFRKFFDHPATIFISEIKNPYKKNKALK